MEAFLVGTPQAKKIMEAFCGFLKSLFKMKKNLWIFCVEYLIATTDFVRKISTGGSLNSRKN